MKITSSILFFILSKNTDLTILNKTSIPFEFPTIYIQGDKRPATLFVVESAEILSLNDISPESVYLICGDAESFPKQLLKMIERKGICAAAVKAEPLTLMNDIHYAIKCLLDWEIELIQMSYGGCDIYSILEHGQKMLNMPFQIVDMNYVYVIYTKDAFSFLSKKHCPEDKIVPASVVTELTQDKEFIAAAELRGVFLYPSYSYKIRFLCKNLFRNDLFVARLLGELYHNPSEGEKELFDILSEYVDKLFSHFFGSFFSKSRNKALQELMHRMIFDWKNINVQDITNILTQYRWATDHEYSVTILEPIDRDNFELFSPYLCQYMESEWTNSCAILCENKIIWILNHSVANERETGKDEFKKHFSPIIRDALCKGGVSNRFTYIFDIAKYVYEAEKALELGKEKDPNCWYYKFCDYFIDFVREQVSVNISNKQVCHKGIVALTEYDKQNDTSYTKALHNYIKCKFNISVAADTTFVHRTTLMRQLEKIKQISGIDFSGNINMRELLHILLSFDILGYI